MINLITGRGRLSRLAYLFSVLGLGIALVIAHRLVLDLTSFTEAARVLNPLWQGDLQVYGKAVDVAVHNSDQHVVRYSALAATLVAALLVFVSLSFRRLQDMGRPGYYACIALVPFVGAQALFAVLIFLPGDPHENRYGARPNTRRAGDVERDLIQSQPGHA